MSGDKSKSLQRIINDLYADNYTTIRGFKGHKKEKNVKCGRCGKTHLPSRECELYIKKPEPYGARPLYPGVVGVVTE